MRILVATDGTLPIEETVAHLKRLYGQGDSVTVMTAVAVPRQFLSQLNALASDRSVSIDQIVDAAGPGTAGMAGGDRVAERLSGGGRRGAVDELLDRYQEQVARERTQPMVDALEQAGIEAHTIVRESSERTAATVIDVCRERRIELLVMGSIGRGRFEGRVGSTGTKLFRNAPCDVLLVRLPTTAPTA